jgi:hypothetical protein
MSQQEPDLPRSVQIIGRNSTLVGIMAALGLLAGVVFVALNSPAFTSTALVAVVPPCPNGAICGGPAFQPGYAPAGLLKALPGGVQTKPVAGDVLSVSAVAGTAAQAEATANAAARSYIAYFGSLSYLGEQVSAPMLQPATRATGTVPPKRLFIGALLGTALGALLGIIAALAGSRTTIDPAAAPQGLDSSGADWGADWGAGQGAGQKARYPSTGLSLEQLAQEYARQRAARDGPLNWSGAAPP